jgi:ribosomal protein S18 acetylase RimI-like enzyme
METIIRPAKPQDAVTVARLMYIAGQGHVEPSVYDLMIPGPPGPTEERLSLLERLFVADNDSMFHYSHCMVTEVDGDVTASLAALDKEDGRRRKSAAALAKIGWTEREFDLMNEAMRPVFRVTPPIPEGAWIIENVATLSEYRRRGLANALLTAALSEGRRRGFACTQLSCFIGNIPAQKAYEKVGFGVTGQYKDRPFEKIFGCPGMSRLVLEL